MTINWRTGIIINSCGHSIHLSCYKQYLKSYLVKFIYLSIISILFSFQNQ